MRKTCLLLLFCLSFGLVAGSAQDDDNPLLRMLARIPDTAAAREYLTYIDYRRLIAARSGATQVTSWLEFTLANNIGGSGAEQLMKALTGVQSGPGFFASIFSVGDEMALVVGFDPFTIERAAEFAFPPGAGTILEGNFNSEAVIDAHVARGYAESDAGDLTLLCSADGCDNGMHIDFDNVNRANPFGGDIGRSQPVLVSDQIIASSPSIDVLKLTASTINSDETSLADDPDYAAAAEAIARSGAPLQAYFINPADILPLSELLTDFVADPATAKNLRAELAKNFVGLPPYNLIAIVDSATDTEQLASVALVYTNQADAEAAAALFPAHLVDFPSMMVQRTFGEMLTDRGVTDIEATVYPASTGRAVMLLTLHAPLAEGDTASSMVYGLLARSYISRDFGWLATEF